MAAITPSELRVFPRRFSHRGIVRRRVAAGTASKADVVHCGGEVTEGRTGGSRWAASTQCEILVTWCSAGNIGTLLGDS
ncbi:hypothetical protein G4Z16_14290 [Streptomyces bathyalis]|uniref:Uncharacterized protein n=1 Tax=Streptomyces bathyalis TaxID=2710756 RepID=A0A7T1WSP7_9ACTN|nr:hypothetical protein [Streptomyces bathyalis]QPP07362.1 hypothetical protein G4Z16_14290 [Streptomyces bathyalis]